MLCRLLIFVVKLLKMIKFLIFEMRISNYMKEIPFQIKFEYATWHIVCLVCINHLDSDFYLTIKLCVFYFRKSMCKRCVRTSWICRRWSVPAKLDECCSIDHLIGARRWWGCQWLNSIGCLTSLDFTKCIVCLAGAIATAFHRADTRRLRCVQHQHDQEITPLAKKQQGGCNGNDIDGLVQVCDMSSANALDIPPSCTKPLILYKDLLSAWNIWIT